VNYGSLTKIHRRLERFVNVEFDEITGIFRVRLAFKGLGSYRGRVIEKLVSGGQTGADIAALDVAIRFGTPHGGWCPKGRRSLAGPIPECYQLTESPRSNYLERTGWNVRDSDGTVVFTLTPEVTGGSLKTIGFAKKHGKPCLHLSQESGGCGHSNPAWVLQKFVMEHGIKTLNVAGSSEAKAPGIYDWVTEMLEGAFFWDVLNPGKVGGPGE
jgi:hypothetical protein